MTKMNVTEWRRFPSLLNQGIDLIDTILVVLVSRAAVSAVNAALLSCQFYGVLYTLCPKNVDYQLMAITLTKHNWFLKFFHRWKEV